MDSEKITDILNGNCLDNILHLYLFYMKQHLDSLKIENEQKTEKFLKEQEKRKDEIILLLEHHEEYDDENELQEALSMNRKRMQEQQKLLEYEEERKKIDRDLNIIKSIASKCCINLEELDVTKLFIEPETLKEIFKHILFIQEL